MQSSSTVHGMSFRKTPRIGQQKVIDAAIKQKRGSLNIQLPTGYGKTFTASAVFSILHDKGVVNRLLYIVPTTAQLDQFVVDGKADFLDAGLNIGSVCDIGFSGVVAHKQNRTNKSLVYATTIQALTSSGKTTWEIVNELMQTGKWMLVVDEYHHYGTEGTWGKEIKKLAFIFTLAMSATPDRPNEDSAFGDAEIKISYRDAVGEKAVKTLHCHSYVYRIDAVMPNGDVDTFTTNDLVEAAGGDSPEKIERLKIERKMRWSPKYVSPLVDAPIARLIRTRMNSRLPLQALVGAMSCSHAELVYDQIKSSYPEFRVDWCGTGTSGRTAEENKKALDGFCPPKRDGKRLPSDIKVDILIHVGMAGEGLDSTYVSEVIHLNPANINNTNNQENGRASRYLEGVVGYINVDSTSKYAPFVGELVMDVMDDPGAKSPENPPSEPEDFNLEDYEPLPDELKAQIWDMECIEIDKGEVDRMKQAYAEVGGYDLSDSECPLHDMAEDLYRSMKRREAEQYNDKSIVAQVDGDVEKSLRAVTHLVIAIMTGKRGRFERSLVGDVKKRINKRKKFVLGAKSKDVENLNKHYKWIKALEEELMLGVIPKWLL